LALALLEAAYRTKVNGALAMAELKLIDMDWAGSEDAFRYPVLLNMKACQWSHDVGPEQPMKRQDDLALLSLQMSPTISARVRVGSK